MEYINKKYMDYLPKKIENEKAYLNAYVVHAIGNIRTEIRTR